MSSRVPNYYKNYGWNKQSLSLAVPLRSRPKRGRPNTSNPSPATKSMISNLLRSQLRGRTATAVNTKRKKKVGKRTRAGGRGQTTFFTKYMKSQRLPKQIYKQLVGHQGVADESHNFALSTIGQQEIIQIPIFLKADLLEIKDTVVGLTNKSAKIFIKSFSGSLHMRNQTNQPCKMKIFDIVCRRDGQISTLDSPGECWNKGLIDLTGVATDSYKIPFQHPMRSDEFKCWWKILNVQSVDLAGGDPHVHHINIKCNRMLDTTVIDTGATSQCIAGWTHYVMVVFLGSLSNSTQVNTEVTFCPIKIDWLYQNTIKFAYLEKNLATYTIQNRPLTTVTGALEAMADNGISNLTPTVN